MSDRTPWFEKPVPEHRERSAAEQAAIHHKFDVEYATVDGVLVAADHPEINHNGNNENHS